MFGRKKPSRIESAGPADEPGAEGRGPDPIPKPDPDEGGGARAEALDAEDGAAPEAPEPGLGAASGGADAPDAADAPGDSDAPSPRPAEAPAARPAKAPAKKARAVKRRGKKRSSLNLFLGAMALGALLPIAAAAAAAWALLWPVDMDGYTVSIAPGEGVNKLAQKLDRDGKIVSPWVFRAAARYFRVKSLSLGDYRIEGSLSTLELLDKLKNEKPDQVAVRIAQGARAQDILRALREDPRLKREIGDRTERQLVRALDPLSRRDSLEGLLFPDTYVVQSGASDLQVLREAFHKMNKVLVDRWRDRDPDLPVSTPYEMLILASIVEKESALASDKAKIAAVFHNRLRMNMRLQADPTVIYGRQLLGDYAGRLTKAQLTEDTPYNTYTRAGLPPTPICSVGEESLRAVARPDKSDYVYFVSKMDQTGESHFSSTLDEHNASVRRYILNQGGAGADSAVPDPSTAPGSDRSESPARQNGQAPIAQEGDPGRRGLGGRLGSGSPESAESAAAQPAPAPEARTPGPDLAH